MAQDIPESKPVVQLPVATHSSIYSHNLTKKDYWINCQAGGLGFYTLLGRNPITLISVGSTSQKIMPAFQIDIGHDYECWLNMLLSMCWDSKFHGFRYYKLFNILEIPFIINQINESNGSSRIIRKNAILQPMYLTFMLKNCVCFSFLITR